MIHCLHGFLGSPRDWDRFDPAFAHDGPLVKADLFGADAFPDALSLAAWADAYGQRVIQDAFRVALLPANQPQGCYLLGYSLGGRLALHLATQFPTLWDGVVIVGANPGLDSPDARAQRRQRDEQWARRFEMEPWDMVLAAWDAQPVFAGYPAVSHPRLESALARERFADALRRWSLGAQMPLWNALSALPCPLLWMAGAEDAGQAAICRRLAETCPRAEIAVVPQAGHRVPWEQPRLFAARVGEFLHTISSQKQTAG